MQPTKILAIAPYEGLRELMIAVAAKRSDIMLEAYVGDLDDGASLAASLSLGGYNVILSRGGTALMIEKSVSIPVIDVAPSLFDVLRCIRLARTHKEKFAVVGFSNITAAAGKLFRLLQNQVDVFTINEPEDAGKCVADLKERGYTLLIGDAIAAATAGKLGLASILITSGEESVQEAFDQAVRMHRATRLLDEQLGLLRLAAGKCDISIMVFNEDGKVYYSNSTDDQKEYPRIFARLSNYVHSVISNGDTHFSRSFKEYIWHIQGQRVELNGCNYAIFTVRRKQATDMSENGMLRFYHMLDANDESKEGLPDTIGRMRAAMDLAAAYGKTLQPVCVAAPRGTPFESVVRALHAQSAWKNHTMLTIDFSSFDDRVFSWLIDSDDSPLSENSLCVCMVGADSLSENNQTRLVRYAQNTLLEKRNRMIQVVRGTGTGIPASPVLTHIGEAGYLMLRLPSLWERREDIGSLCSIYLGKINAECGRQVIGLDAGAESLLCGHPWPGNNTQLYTTLKMLVISAKDDMITGQQAAEVLREEESPPAASDAEEISLKGTLAEINVRVIRKILAQENMNQVKTAKRLGIGRSTLWRVLGRDKGGDGV